MVGLEPADPADETLAIFALVDGVLTDFALVGELLVVFALVTGALTAFALVFKALAVFALVEALTAFALVGETLVVFALVGEMLVVFALGEMLVVDALVGETLVFFALGGEMTVVFALVKGGASCSASNVKSVPWIDRCWDKMASTSEKKRWSMLTVLIVMTMVAMTVIIFPTDSYKKIILHARATKKHEHSNNMHLIIIFCV